MRQLGRCNDASGGERVTVKKLIQAGGALVMALLMSAAAIQASSVYWTGDNTRATTKYSTVRTTTGGYTNLGSTQLTAWNAGVQYGYAFQTVSSPQGHVLNSYSARPDTQNACWWDSGAYRGALWMQCTVYYN